MRKTILTVAACLIGLGQAAFAEEPINADRYNTGYKVVVRFSKTGASYASFMYDRNDCVEATMHRDTGKEFRTSLGGRPGVHVTYDLPGLVTCMQTRGYQLDPKGYHALAFRQYKDGHQEGIPFGKWND